MRRSRSGPGQGSLGNSNVLRYKLTSAGGATLRVEVLRGGPRLLRMESPATTGGTFSSWPSDRARAQRDVGGDACVPVTLRPSAANALTGTRTAMRASPRSSALGLKSSGYLAAMARSRISRGRGGRRTLPDLLPLGPQRLKRALAVRVGRAFGEPVGPSRCDMRPPLGHSGRVVTRGWRNEAFSAAP